MIKKVIQIADIHVRNFLRYNEYTLLLENLLNKCKEIVGEDKEEFRIALVGDLFHSKNVSPEATLMIGWLLRELNNICKTIVICGNHDCVNVLNDSRVDNLTPIFSLARFDNCVYLDKELNYQSGLYEDDNIVWCLMSIFDGLRVPNEIVEYKAVHKDKVFIGLCHGEIVSATTDIGRSSERGLSPSSFSDMDLVMMGDIHKYQEIKSNGVKMVYSGSPIQQNFGENIGGHGFVLWDVAQKDYELIELNNNEYGLYKFVVDSIEDLDKNKERLLNV